MRRYLDAVKEGDQWTMRMRYLLLGFVLGCALGVLLCILLARVAEARPIGMAQVRDAEIGECQRALLGNADDHARASDNDVERYRRKFALYRFVRFAKTYVVVDRYRIWTKVWYQGSSSNSGMFWAKGYCVRTTDDGLNDNVGREPSGWDSTPPPAGKYDDPHPQ